MIFKDKVTYDAITKKATIMRDGIYLYMPSELGIQSENNYPIPVLRPAEEVEKAYKRFNQLMKLPIVSDHIDDALNLKDESSYKHGFAYNPTLENFAGKTTIDCEVELKGKTLQDYQSGTKELSCDMLGKIEPAKGKTYDYIQRFTDINNIALVEIGRCGDICKIKDGGKDMPKLLEVVKKILENLGVVMDEAKIQAALDTVTNLSTEKTDGEPVNNDIKEPSEPVNNEAKEVAPIEPTIEEPKKDEAPVNEGMKKEEVNPIEPKKDEAPMDTDVSSEAGEPFHVEMDTEKLVALLVSAGVDEAKATEVISSYLGGLKDSAEKVETAAEEKKEEKSLKDCDKVTKDSARFLDAVNKARTEMRKTVISRYTKVLPVIRSSEFQASEFKDKSPCEIMSMFIKKQTGLDISTKDSGLDVAYAMALKQWEDPNWKTFKDSYKPNSLVDEINNITFGGK